VTGIKAGDVVRYDLPATAAALAAYPEWQARNGREFIAIEDETPHDGVELWDDHAETPFAAVGAYCTVIRRSAPVIPGFYIAPDPFDDTILWWRDPSHDEPQPIVMQAEVPPALWQAIAVLAGHAPDEEAAA
jgi:hypothetical protein